MRYQVPAYMPCCVRVLYLTALSHFRGELTHSCPLSVDVSRVALDVTAMLNTININSAGGSVIVLYGAASVSYFLVLAVWYA